MRYIGCTRKTPNNPDVAAAVCAPNTKAYTIAIAQTLYNLPPYADLMDSQLLTLVHEVSHCHESLPFTVERARTVKVELGR